MEIEFYSFNPTIPKLVFQTGNRIISPIYFLASRTGFSKQEMELFHQFLDLRPPQFVKYMTLIGSMISKQVLKIRNRVF